MNTQNNDAPNHNTVLRMKDLIRRLGLSRSTIYDRLNPKSDGYDPTFPRKIRLGKSAVGFRDADVSAWLKANEVTPDDVQGN